MSLFFLAQQVPPDDGGGDTGGGKPPVGDPKVILDYGDLADAVVGGWVTAFGIAFVVVFGFVVAWFLLHRMKRMGPKGWGI